MSQSDESAVLKVLLGRKSVRAFQPLPVSPPLKDQILDAALRAPTAGNQMLYTILDIGDQTIRDRLAELCDHQPFIAQAPLVLVFLADCRRWLDVYREAGAVSRQPGPADLILAIEDAMIAAHASVVAADALGLGSCYIGDIVEHRESMVDLLHLDPLVFPISLVVYGHPTEQQKARPQPRRFAREHIVLPDVYRPRTGEELRTMLAEREANPNFDFDGWVKRFCERKYMSDFSLEMNRSVREYARAFWDTPGRDDPKGS